MLLSAVVAAGTLCSQAYAGWGSDDGSSYYQSDALEIDAVSTYDAQSRNVYQIKAGKDKDDQHTIGKLTIHDDKTVRLMWNWDGDTSLNALITELQIGADGTGKTSDFRNDAGNVINIGKVSGTLANLYNGGTMTIGGEDTTTTIGGTLYNNGPSKGGTDTTSSIGTMILNGNIAISADASFTGFVLDTTRGVGYSAADGNGYRTITNAHYYLVQGGTSIPPQEP